MQIYKRLYSFQNLLGREPEYVTNCPVLVASAPSAGSMRREKTDDCDILSLICYIQSFVSLINQRYLPKNNRDHDRTPPHSRAERPDRGRLPEMVWRALRLYLQKDWMGSGRRCGRPGAGDFPYLLSCKSPLAGDRLVRFIYKVAKNQVIDYLRHHACIDAARIYFQEHARRDSCCTEEEVAAHELERLERESLDRMPHKKAQVYALYAHEGKSVQEISSQLALSRRTVENHIFRARSEIREYLSVC